jgi:hypothetical protein
LELEEEEEINVVIYHVQVVFLIDIIALINSP